MSKYRGRPAGFWELLNDEDRAGITLQRISEELDKGEIVAYDEIYIDYDDTWQDIQAKLYGERSHSMMAEAIQKFNQQEFSPKSLETVGDHYTLPQTPSTVLKYVVKNTQRRLKRR
jgi:methionyl-tRNA formyltransferase